MLVGNRSQKQVCLYLCTLKGNLLNNTHMLLNTVARELGFSHSNTIIVHDDMQRELGKISIKNGGSAK